MVQNIIGEFEANGVIGLAPADGEKSYIHQLYAQGEVEELKVGLNYENPADSSSVSTVSFGEWAFDQVHGGEEGLNYYPNAATSHWAVMMDDVSYDDKDIQGAVGGKIALIDSGNTSIQLPESEFRQLKSYMLD